MEMDGNGHMALRCSSGLVRFLAQEDSTPPEHSPSTLTGGFSPPSAVTTTGGSRAPGGSL